MKLSKVININRIITILLILVSPFISGMCDFKDVIFLKKEGELYGTVDFKTLSCMCELLDEFADSLNNHTYFVIDGKIKRDIFYIEKISLMKRKQILKSINKINIILPISLKSDTSDTIFTNRFTLLTRIMYRSQLQNVDKIKKK